MEMPKISNGYEDIARSIFFSIKNDRTWKEQCRFDIRKYSFSQKMINE